MKNASTCAQRRLFSVVRPGGKAGVFFVGCLIVMGFICGEKQVNSDPARLFREMKERFLQVNDYTCELQAFSANERKTQSEFYQLYFKKPKQLRVEVVGGANNGSVLLFRAGGDVRVKQGKGLGALLPLSFRPDHPWVCNLRGFGLHQSDWGWLIDEHIQFLSYFSMRDLRQESLDGRSTRVVELISRDPAKTMNMARELMWIDDQWHLPVKYLMYDTYGKLIQSMLCWNIQINRGLSENLFTNFEKKS